MKYLKTYNLTLTLKLVYSLIKKHLNYIENIKLHDYEYHLKDKIHYFNGFDKWGGSDEFRKSCRYIIAYNNDDILGVCQFAYWGSGGHYAISYCSTNRDYLSMGVSKRILEELFKYFSETYPNETLNFSGYSIDGWRYLRKYILEYSKKYNVKIFEKWMEYPGVDKHGVQRKQDDDFYDLYRKSKEEVKQIYGEDKYY